MMTDQIETTSFDDLYKGVSHQIRTILVATVSVIIGILTLYVFPLPRFGIEDTEGNFISILDSLSSSQVQLIILSNILGILLTYFYFSIVSEISQKGSLILHNLVLVNIIIASIVIEIPYFSTFSLLIYLGVTMLSIKLRPADTRNEFISISIIMIHVATLLIWYIKGYTHIIDTFEPVSTQIILLIATVLYCRNKQRKPLLNLPLLLNVLLIPLIMQNEYTIDGVLLFRDDISLLLFGSIMVINAVLAILYRETTYSKYVIISSTILIFAEHIMLSAYRSSIFDIYHLDILGITITQISIWYLILLGSILLIWFTSDQSFPHVVTGSIFLLTIMFTLTLDINPGIIVIPHLFLIIGIFCTSVILLMRFSQKELYIPLLQALSICLLSTIPGVAYSEILQTLSIIGFIIISVFTWFRHQHINRVTEIIMGSFGGLVILYILSWNSSFLNQVDYIILILLTFSIGIITMLVKNKQGVVYGLVIQAISFFFISLLEREMIILGLDWLDLGIIVFIVELILLSLKYKSETYVMRFNASVPVFLFISIVLRSYLGNYTLPNEILLGILVILPTIQLYLSNIDNTTRYYAIALQGVGIAFFTSINQFVGLMNLISFLYLAFILLSIVVWYIKKFENLFVVYLALTSSLLQLFFVILSSDKLKIPGIIEMGIAIVLIAALLNRVKDSEYSRLIVISQSLVIIFLGFFSNQVMVSNNSLVKASSSLFNFSNITHIPWVSLILIIFVIIVGVFWIRSNNEEYNFTPLILMGLFLILNLGYMVDNYKSTPPFLLALMTLFVASILIKREDKYHLHALVLAVANIFLMLLNSHQIIILPNSINLGVISIVYLIFSLLIMYQWRIKKEDKAFPIIIVIAVLTLLLSIISHKSYSYSVPIEFLVIVTLSLSFVMFNAKNVNYLKFLSMMQSIIVAIILLREGSIKLLITTGDTASGYLLTSSVLFVGFSLLAIFVLKNADDFFNWLTIMGSYLLVVAISSLKLYTIHPIIIGISIIILSYLSYANSFHHVKELVPVAQGFGIILLILNEIGIAGQTATYSSIFFVVFTIATFVVWYLSGKDKQLMYSYITIFALGLILTLFSIGRNYLVIHEFSILSSLIFATGFLIAFYSRLRKLDPIWLIGVLVVASTTLAVVSRSFESQFSGNTALLLRLALDWLIFVPLMVETAIYIKRYIETKLQSEDRARTGDYLIILLQLILTITALLMGSTGILSLKLLAVAMVFWIFATVFISNYLAWGTSINTAFTLAFLIAQLGAGSSDYVLYFIVLTIIGFLMVGAALINDKIYIGEPLTSSLLITGSTLSAISILAPLMFSGDQFINFLPNIVWAIQGLGLFVIAMRMNKETWRKMALSILLVDILKTGFDIFSQSNDFIRIIGSIVLGAVLILIFYLFTKEEGSNVEIVQEEE